MNVKHLGDDALRTFWSAAIEHVQDFRPPFTGTPYVCLLWPLRPYSIDERIVLSTHLLGSGWRYVVCGGVDSPFWEETVDHVGVQLTLLETLPAHEVIMTTAHQDEVPEDIVFFFVHCTVSTSVDAPNYLLLVLGDHAAQRHALEQLLQSEALA